MKTLNLGILAHVDAGKTSLTERLLHAAGVIDEIGSVDQGNTQTDTLQLEQQRGITIKSAMASFVKDDVMINLIDTPGHSDFIAEVERVLNVLDGVVLVISAVEGVQSQTRVLMRTLQRLKLPTLLFINKIDRAGADTQRTLDVIRTQLAPEIIPMGSAAQLGTRQATYGSSSWTDAGFRSQLVDHLVEQDDALLAAYVADETAISPSILHDQLALRTRSAQVHPVFFGSAATGAGIDELITGIVDLLPACEGLQDGPLSGTVFKIDRGSAGEKVAYVRMFSGTLRLRDRLQLLGDHEGKITGLQRFDRGKVVPATELTAGQIGKVWGLGRLRIGDAVGDVIGDRPGPTADHYFSPPTLETVVLPARRIDRGPLHLALTQLVEQDPLINMRQDPIRNELSVSLYGEVQKEVIQSTLANEFGLSVDFRETTTICIERPIGVGCALEVIKQDANPFLATVGLRVDPAAPDAGLTFGLEVEPGAMPAAFFKAVEETVLETLSQGLLGWQVHDCMITMTHSGYWARQSHAHATFDKSMSSTAGDFRNLTPLVLMEALRRGGTQVMEPIHRFDLEVPADALGPALAALAQLRAITRENDIQGQTCRLRGEIPAARVHELQLALPALTQGAGVLDSSFDHYQAVHGTSPVRPRTDDDPLHRKDYLLRVQRRMP